MKNFTYRSLAFAGLLCLTFFSSCDEDAFLETQPIDFFSPENSFGSAEDFEAAVINLHSRMRDDFHSDDDEDLFPSAGVQATDIFYLHKNIGFKTDISSIYLPTNNLMLNALWAPAYRIIFDANVIIGRAPSENNQLTADERRLFIAEAKFFRGLCYKMLANLFGGVPLVLEETKSPNRDFIRATREEVYQHAALDLEEASKNLPDIDDVEDHRVGNLAAYHVISEVYISLNRWQDAINAASTVIDHPSTALMTERFGTRANEKFLIPQYDTDVYWDLFRQGNQNRSSGNSEALWVLQYEWETPGGFEASQSGGPLLERIFSPRLWQAKVENNNGKTKPLVPKPNAFTGGRSSGFLRPTHFFFHTLWDRSGFGQDIRNSDANIVRDFLVRNPDSDHNGKWALKDNLPVRLASLNDTTRNFYPWMTKVSTPGNQPAPAFVANPSVEGEVSWSHHAFREKYAIRMAETYLLRAEGYLGAGNLDMAAEDINTVRRRAQAPEISPDQVNIDYILDERARELYVEEFRLLTLARLGLLVERTQKYNSVNGPNYQDHHNLWPIPFSEMEKNLEGNLEQNPGY